MSTVSSSAIVVIGGDPPDPRVLDHLVNPITVFAADSGVDHALALGISVDTLVGDLDSVTASGLDKAVAAGAAVHRHPTDKDATDTELAIELAADTHDHVTVLSGGGDRLDHLLGTIAVVAQPRRATIDAYVGTAHLQVARTGSPVVIDRPVGTLVSILPMGGDAVVTTTGLRWPLAADTVSWHASRGISNEVVSTPARVEVSTGTAAVVVPHALGGES